VNRTERLLDLIAYLLNARGPVPWQEIKNHFPEDYARGVEESNQRKFERDKAELVSLGIPIEYQQFAEDREEGYFIRKEKLFLAELEFSPREASLLMLAASAVLESDAFPYGEQLESALSKIIGIHQRAGVTPPELSISYSERAKSAHRSALLRQIQEALDRRKTISFRYHAFSTGRTTLRTVNPYGLIFRKGKWTLIGYDHLRKGIRSFVLNRIIDPLPPLRRPRSPDYQIPKKFSLRAYQNRQPWELEVHAPVSATIQVSPHRMPELASQLASARRIDERTFELRVTNTPGLVSWALSQKTDVVILAPDEIRRQAADVLRGLV
jgi:proteasome accessory factor B